MKILINAAKQVGEITHCTRNAQTLFNILQTGEVWLSDSGDNKYVEFNPKTGRDDYFSSFSRDPIRAIKRNPKRWSCGVILNGNKLSEHYHIEPYSYSGVKRTEIPRIKYITKYDDGSCYAYFVNWGSKHTSIKMYDYFVEKLNNLPEDIATKKKFQIVGSASRKTNGKKRVEQYKFNVKNGDGGYLLKDAPDSIRTEIRDMKDEKEERIWKGNYNNIDIRNSIVGIIIPENKKDEFKPVIDYFLNNYSSHRIMYY